MECLHFLFFWLLLGFQTNALGYSNGPKEEPEKLTEEKKIENKEQMLRWWAEILRVEKHYSGRSGV